jgi:DNA-binding CsgD family transcriptional regulator
MREPMNYSKENECVSYMEALKRLSIAEIRVLEGVEQGKTSREIAKELGISTRTVHKHRETICRKLSIKGRNGLLKWVLKARG